MFAPEEVEFIMGGQEQITIIPTVRLPKLQLSTGQLSLTPNQPVQVPLWLALTLRKARHCHIPPPPFLHLPSLLSILHTQELSTPAFSSSLPPHWYELALILFRHAAEEFGGELEECRRTVQMLREVRWGKVAKGVKEVDGAPLELTGLSMMELNVVAKPFLIPAMQKLCQLRKSTLYH